jgi:ECF transporter S component (folate family)
MPKVKQLALAGLLLATNIVLVRFVSIQFEVLRLSFGYITFILAGWLLGPVWGAVIGVAGDLLGMLLWPKGSFFPGFTLSALLEGLIYGLFLFGRQVDRRFFVRLVLGILVVHIFVQLGLTTLWLTIMYKRAFFVVLAGRVLANAITFPIELVSMFFLMRIIERPVDKYFRAKPFTEDDNGDIGSPPEDSEPTGR